MTNTTFPYGMQWSYPCGGLKVTQNRTYWSTEGGALAFQPGWFSGHETAFLYVNIGLDKDGPDGGPMNFTTPLAAPWQLLGPSNGPYPGTLCLKDIKVPKEYGVKAGDLATIQVVELAAHGGSLFGCSDIEFVEPGDKRIPPLNDTVCFNETTFGAAEIHTFVTKPPMINGKIVKTNAADANAAIRWLGYLPLLAGSLWILI